MKKIAIVAALAMSGLLFQTADAQVGVSLGLHFGSHRNDAPVARIAVQAPVYERNTIPEYYTNDERYNYDRDAYRGRERWYDRHGRMDDRYAERYDRRIDNRDRGEYRNDQRYEQNNMLNNRNQDSNYGSRNNYGGQQHAVNSYTQKTSARW